MTHQVPLKPLHAKVTPLFPGLGTTCVKNTLILVLGLLHRRTTCLYRLKAVVGLFTGRSATTPRGHYKRLVRYFDAHADGDLWLDLTAAALRLLGDTPATYLVLDGTSWERGGRWQHLLTLCVVYEGVAIPLIWVDLQKKGTSNYAERVDLLGRAIERFDLRGKLLLADREYIGVEWFEFLIDNGLDFCIRSRDRAYFRQMDRTAPEQPRLHEMIARVKASRCANCAKRLAFRLWDGGPRLWVVCAKNPDPNAKATDAVMILITSVDQGPYRTVGDYLTRWKVEHCFRHLKSNGFDLEQVNLATVERRRLMIAVVVFAYVLSVVEGLKDYARKTRFKRHGTNGHQYREVSVFRYGTEALARYATDLVAFMHYLAAEIQRVISGQNRAGILNV